MNWQNALPISFIAQTKFKKLAYHNLLLVEYMRKGMSGLNTPAFKEKPSKNTIFKQKLCKLMFCYFWLITDFFENL